MPTATKDLYEILGVSRNATEADIKKAFRKRARELHPDVNKSENAEEQFKELNEAYDVLSDANKRAQYDRFGTIPGAGSAGSGYVDFEDIFGGFGGMGDFFSSFFGGGAGRSQTVQREGRDMGLSVNISLKEAASGIKKEVVYNRMATCTECGGSGLGADGKQVTCTECDGTGTVVTVQQTFLGSMRSQTTCRACGGTGHIIEGECEECNGDGRVPDRQRVSVDIPAGIRDGQQMRVPDLGEAGYQGAKTGDLIVTVRIERDDFFERDGDDLHVRITIPMTQAALGGKVEIPGILEDETVSVRIPKATQFGDIVKVKGYGMPRVRDDSRGTLYIHIDIEIPKRLSKKEKRLLENLADEMGDDIGELQATLDKLD